MKPVALLLRWLGNLVAVVLGFGKSAKGPKKSTRPKIEKPVCITEELGMPCGGCEMAQMAPGCLQSAMRRVTCGSGEGKVITFICYSEECLALAIHRGKEFARRAKRSFD